MSQRAMSHPYKRVQNHEPISPPRDLHHLWWCRRDYKGELEQRFMSIGCSRQRVDIVAHAYVHRCYGIPSRPSSAVMNDVVDRHAAEVCGCYDHGLLVPASLLHIGREDPNVPPPECVTLPWDPFVLEKLQEYYQPKTMGMSWLLRRLRSRHKLGVCSCNQASGDRQLAVA
jgi:hypothetical protein